MEIGSPVWLRQKDGWKVAQVVEKVVGVKCTKIALLVGEKNTRVEIYMDNGVEETDSLKLRNIDQGTCKDHIDDLIELTHLNEPSILHVLYERFQKNIIYTNNGPILLAVNPFKELSLYTQQHLELYYNQGLLKSKGVEILKPLPPHVYAVADTAYRQMMDSFLNHPSAKTAGIESQSILVSGESGAGKTETTKFLMKYLATVGNASNENENSITGRVLDSNPILEAFGNACTVRNENSSRFGKFIQLQFNSLGELVGASIQTYLLEKIRIVNQALNERNYHVFYQLCSGATVEMKEKWHLDDAETYHYLDQGDTFVLSETDDAKNFEVTCKAMNSLGFSSDEINDTFQVLSALLHLGNITPKARNAGENRDEEAELDEENINEAHYCAELFNVKLMDLERALCTRKIAARHETIEKRLTTAQSIDSRDALAKSIYSKLFDWIVYRLNDCVKMTKEYRSFISVLDIFGFEIFEKNNFEQLCINYTNEKLQQQFNQHIFTIEQELYREEKISWSFINYPDNQECLDLMEDRPSGIISLIDDEIRIPGGNDRNLAHKFYRLYENHSRFNASSKDRVEFRFVIRHYAGDVSYETGGFCEKNRDTLPNSVVEFIENSSPFVQCIVKCEYLIKPKIVKSRSKSRKPEPPKPTVNQDSHDTITSVGSQFKQQLQNLMDCIHSTSPHFIRCLKPNDMNVRDIFDQERIIQQLQYGGVLEAVKVAQSGYPIRMPHAEFYSRYKMISTNSKNIETNCETIVKDLQIDNDEIQIGVTRIFLRKGTYNRVEGKRVVRMFQASTKISKNVRGRKIRLWYANVRRCCVLIQSCIRMHRAILYSSCLRKTNAAIRLQSFVRSCLAIKRYQKCLASIVLLQSLARGMKDRKISNAIRRNKSVTLIQVNMRMYIYRKAYLFNRKNVIQIQNRWRCRIAGRLLRTLKQEARDLGNLQQKNKTMKLEMEILKERIADEAREREVATRIKQLETEAKLLALEQEAEETQKKLEEKQKQLEEESRKKQMETEVEAKTKLLALAQEAEEKQKIFEEKQRLQEAEAKQKQQEIEAKVMTLTLQAEEKQKQLEEKQKELVERKRKEMEAEAKNKELAEKAKAKNKELAEKAEAKAKVLALSIQEEKQKLVQAEERQRELEAAVAQAEAKMLSLTQQTEVRQKQLDEEVKLLEEKKKLLDAEVEAKMLVFSLQAEEKQKQLEVQSSMLEDKHILFVAEAEAMMKDMNEKIQIEIQARIAAEQALLEQCTTQVEVPESEDENVNEKENMVDHLKYLLQSEIEKNGKLENDVRELLRLHDRDDNNQGSSQHDDLLSIPCHLNKTDRIPSDPEIHFPRARPSDSNQSLAAFEANLHTIKVKLVVGIPMVRVEKKQRIPLILKLSLEKGEAAVILSNYSYLVVETLLLEDIVEVTTASGNCSGTRDETIDYFLSIITSTKTIQLTTTNLDDRNHVATGLRNVIADMSLRQQPLLQETMRSRTSSAASNSDKSKSMTNILRRASAQRLLSKKAKVNRVLPEGPVDEPKMHLLKMQLREYEQSYEKVLVKLMETVNELQDKNACILRLKKKNEDLVYSIEQSNHLTEQNCLPHGNKLERAGFPECEVGDLIQFEIPNTVATLPV